MTRKAGFCPTCGASKCHQRWHPHAMTDFSHELVDDARLSNMNTADVFKCPSCGFVGCVVEYHQNGGGFWDLDIPCDCEPRFCPECGERMSEIELKPCKRWWDSPNRSETTAKLLRKVVDE